MWGGAALLGWIAGEMMATDPLVAPHLGLPASHFAQYVFATAGAAVVVVLAWMLKQGSKESEA